MPVRDFEAQPLHAQIKVHQQHRDAFSRIAPAGCQQVVIDKTHFTGRQPGDVVAKIGMLAVQRPQTVARKHTQTQVGDRLDAVRGSFAEILL